MHRLLRSAALAAILLSLCVAALRAQPRNDGGNDDGYADNAALGRRLAAIARDHPDRVAVRRLAKTAGGRDIWLATIGGASADANPAVLVVGGVDGPRLVGSELALRIVERLAADASDSTRLLLQRVTVYVIPRASPDALDAFFARPRVERAVNENPSDDDRDGAVDEDGVDDLDGNGVITQMRVRRAGGRYLADPADPRVLRLADASRGEQGLYELMSEGRDDDRDGAYNEDGPGGVDIDRNFPFEYRPFSRAAGAHAASEIETRALADFCYDHQNIAAVFAFSSQSNLLHPWQARPEQGGGRIIRTVSEADAGPLARLAEIYADITGQKAAPSFVAPPYVKGEGSFVEWAYYDYGRVALGTPGWWLTADGAKTDSSRRPALADTLAWLESRGVEAFVPWKQVELPEFPSGSVEVGGIVPFAAGEPPSRQLDSLAAPYARFVVRLGALLPRIELSELRTEPLGDGLTRVRAVVVNTGYMPTLLAMGERSRVPIDVKAELTLARGQTLAAGRRVQLLGALAGSGGSKELTWVIAGRGDVRLVIGGPMTGGVERTVSLR
jgi:hypothetical protein